MTKDYFYIVLFCLLYYIVPCSILPLCLVKGKQNVKKSSKNSLSENDQRQH